MTGDPIGSVHRWVERKLDQDRPGDIDLAKVATKILRALEFAVENRDIPQARQALLSAMSGLDHVETAIRLAEVREAQDKEHEKRGDSPDLRLSVLQHSHDVRGKLLADLQNRLEDLEHRLDGFDYLHLKTKIGSMERDFASWRSSYGIRIGDLSDRVNSIISQTAESARVLAEIWRHEPNNPIEEEDTES